MDIAWGCAETNQDGKEKGQGRRAGEGGGEGRLVLDVWGRDSGLVEGGTIDFFNTIWYLFC